MNVDIGFMRDIENGDDKLLFWEKRRYLQLSVFCALEGSRMERMLKRLSPLLLIKPKFIHRKLCLR